MKNNFVDKITELLISERNEIIVSLKKNDEDYTETIENSLPKDFADLASYSTDRTMLEFIGASNIKKLQKIDSALERIRLGKYGKCISCNKPISEDRLKALPYALKCIECQSLDEKKSKK